MASAFDSLHPFFKTNNAMNPFEIKTNISQREYMNISYPGFFRKWKIIIAVAVIFILISYLNSHSKGDPALFNATFRAVFMPLIPFIGLSILIWMGIRFQSNKIYTNAALSHGITYCFSEENIKVRGRDFSSVIEWHAIENIKALRNFHIIKLHSRAVIIIRKTDISGEQINFIKRKAGR